MCWYVMECGIVCGTRRLRLVLLGQAGLTVSSACCGTDAALIQNLATCELGRSAQYMDQIVSQPTRGHRKCVEVSHLLQQAGLWLVAGPVQSRDEQMRCHHDDRTCESTNVAELHARFELNHTVTPTVSTARPY